MASPEKKKAFKKLVEAFEELGDGTDDALIAVLLSRWFTEGVDQDVINQLCEVCDLRDQREKARAIEERDHV